MDVTFLNSIAAAYYETLRLDIREVAMEAMRATMLCGLGMQQFTNSLYPWCNNAQCNNSEDNLFFSLGVYFQINKSII